MTQSRSSKSLLSAALLGLISASAHAHTWIEQLMLLDPTGAMTGTPGFPRGFQPRGAGFNEALMVSLIPTTGNSQIFPTDTFCRAEQQQATQRDATNFPRLKAVPGANVALRYQENGHVTQPGVPAGKPKNSGTVYVYGTTQPKATDKFLDIHRVWTADGKGGDGRGKLLSTQSFDDGQCYQVNGGPISAQRQKEFSHANVQPMGGDVWCQQDIQIPLDAPTGQPYTLYWVWDWATLPGTAGLPNGKQELYTTCMDVDIAASPPSSVKVNIAGTNKLSATDVNVRAIAAEFNDIANPTRISDQGQTIAFSSASGTPKPSAEASTVTPVFVSEHSSMSSILSVSSALSASSAASVSAKASSAGVPAQATSQAQATSTGGRGGRGSGRASQSAAVSTVVPIPAAGQSSPGQQAASPSTPVQQPATQQSAAQSTATQQRGGRPTAAPGMATVTEFDTVFQTMFQTVYNTKFTKRDAEADPTVAPVAADAKQTGLVPPPPSSKTEAAYMLRARSPFKALPKFLQPGGGATAGQ